MQDTEKADYLKSHGWSTETGKLYGWTWYYKTDEAKALYFLEDAMKIQLGFNKLKKVPA